MEDLTLEEILGEELRLRERPPVRIAGVGSWIPLLASKGTIVDAGDLVANRSVGDLIDLEIDGTFATVDGTDQPTKIEFPLTSSGMDYAAYTARQNSGIGTNGYRNLFEMTAELVTSTVVPTGNGAFVEVSYQRAAATTTYGAGWQWQGAGVANRRPYQNTNGGINAAAYGNDEVGLWKNYHVNAAGAKFFTKSPTTQVGAAYRFGITAPWTVTADDPAVIFLGSNLTAERVQVRAWYRAICVADPTGKNF